MHTAVPFKRRTRWLFKYKKSPIPLNLCIHKCEMNRNKLPTFPASDNVSGNASDKASGDTIDNANGTANGIASGNASGNIDV